jgi:hypothetical protein
MIKTADFISGYREGKVPGDTLIKMAAFKEELLKSAAGASFLTTLANSVKTQLPTAIGMSAGMGLAGLVFAGMKAIEGEYEKFRLDASKVPLYQEMIALHPELARNEKDEEITKRYYEALWHFSPNIAQNPMTAGSYIKQSLSMHHLYQGPLPEMVEKATSIQKNITQGAPEQKEFATPFSAFLMPLKPSASGAYNAWKPEKEKK